MTGAALARVVTVCLDVNETIFPADAAASVFTDLGLNPSDVKSWFAEVLRDAFAAQLSGDFVPFTDIAGHHLVRHVRKAGGNTSVTKEEAAGKLADAWERAQPHPDIAPGLEALQAAGIKISAMTNGSMNIAKAVLARAGVRDAAVFDINEAMAWKPDRNAYTYVANALLLDPAQIMLVSCHPWDCHGAMAAGFQAAYVQRDPADEYPSFLRQPAIVGASMVEVATKLVTPSSAS